MSEKNPYLQMHQASNASSDQATSASPSSAKKIQRSNTVTPPTDTDNDGNGKPNPYLALRQANIARNEARLRELGLLKSSPKRGVKRNKPSSSSSVATTTSTSNSQPVRRSSRRTAKRSINYKEDTVDNNTAATTEYRQAEGKEHDETELPSEAFVPLENDDEEEGDNDTPNSNTDKTNRSKPVKPNKPRTTATTILSNLAPNSARSIALNVHSLVLDPQRGWLGKPMTATGKAIVMETAAQQFATTDDNNYRKISFNKYAGAQDWKRGMFLWVNLGGAKGNTVVNDFLQEGRKMTWYGGSRMKAESNIIQKLLQVGRGANDNNNQQDGIVLWCRRYEASRKNFGPYYCLGRLAYDSHNPNVMPVSFVWKLLDYDALVAQRNEVVQQMMSS